MNEIIHLELYIPERQLIKPKVVEMKYDDLRRECLQFGDFHPDEAGDLATIVAAIVRKGLPFPNQLAIKMAEYIEDERHSRLRLAASAGESR